MSDCDWEQSWYRTLKHFHVKQYTSNSRVILFQTAKLFKTILYTFNTIENNYYQVQKNYTVI